MRRLSREQCLRIGLGMFAAAVFIGIVIVNIFALHFSANTKALHRHALVYQDRVRGVINMDTVDRYVSWELKHNLGPLLYIYVMGPITGSGDSGPLDFALCGSPGAVSCDNSVAGECRGRITEITPGGLGVVPAINAVRANPAWFYAELSNGVDTVKINLGTIAGWP